MKVYCKRTYFEVNKNYSPVNGKKYGESYILWKKYKLYDARPANEWEDHLGIVFTIETEQTGWSKPIKRNDFEKHFILQSQLRDNLLDKLIPPV